MRDVHDGITLSLCARVSSVPLVALPALFAEDIVGDCAEFWRKPRGIALVQRGSIDAQDQPPQPPASLQRLSLRDLEAVHRLGLCGFMHRKCSKASWLFLAPSNPDPLTPRPSAVTPQTLSGDPPDPQ